MQKRLAIGLGVKILDQKKKEGGVQEPPPPSTASLRAKENIVGHYVTKQRKTDILYVRLGCSKVG